jgi:hypothetical protein
VSSECGIPPTPAHWDKVNDTARVLIDWAIEHHREWFHECER